MKKYFKQLKANKKGFTLIEMIVVIAIIGILAAILVPSMAGYLETSRTSRKEANAKTVYTAAQAAVTSLEATKPLDSAEKTYDVVPGTGTNKDEDLIKKIQGLLGNSNYSKLKKLEVTVSNGAVTQIVVNDGSEDVTYPEQPAVTGGGAAGAGSGPS